MIKFKFYAVDQNGDPVFTSGLKNKLVKHQVEGFFTCSLDYESEHQLSEAFIDTTNLFQEYIKWNVKQNKGF